MKMNVTLLGVTLSLLLSGQSAFAQQAPAPQTAPQTVKVQTSTHQAFAQQSTQLAQNEVRVVKSPVARRKIKIIREAIPGQNQATSTLSRGRVIHRTDLAVENISVYRPTARVTSTPNLYKN